MVAWGLFYHAAHLPAVLITTAPIILSEKATPAGQKGIIITIIVAPFLFPVNISRSSANAVWVALQQIPDWRRGWFYHALACGRAHRRGTGFGLADGATVATPLVDPQPPICRCWRANIDMLAMLFPVV